jgi:hypothetical protein
MIWLELRTNPTEYDAGWRLKESAWAPTRRENGRKSPFYYLINEVVEGDTVMHLVERDGRKEFIGYSTAATDGYITQAIPTANGHVWNFSEAYYKVELKDFRPFHPVIQLSQFFGDHEVALRAYFQRNGLRRQDKRRLFYVIQRNRLQCFYGAYFSELDETLASLITNAVANTQRGRTVLANSPTGTALRELQSRIGHQRFSGEVKRNFGHKCCFPGCSVEGNGFVVSGHIARWADNEALRGQTANGLCFCLMHDKAFEKGFFTLDERYRVVIVNSDFSRRVWLEEMLVSGAGSEIKPRQIDPSVVALREHWRRIGYAG